MTRSLLHHTPSASALWVLAFACNGTETDNPIAGGQQGSDFESPPSFEPRQSPPGCVPDLADAPPRDLPLWGVSGDYLVGLDSGLVVVDVTDPAAPNVVARHALHGEPRQLLVEGTEVTLVIDELPMFEQPPVPAPEELDAVTRLIRFDISEPSAPVRVAEVALENEFWRLVPRAGGYWVMSARVVPPEPTCELPNPYGCGYVERDALVLERYTFDGGAFTGVEQTELPMTNRAFSTEHGFAAATRTDTGGVLSIARFDASGGLGAPQAIAFEGELAPYAPIYMGPERTAFFASGLHVGEATGAPSASLTSLSGDAQSRFIDRGVFVTQNGAPVTFVDWSDLGMLRSAPLAGVSHVVPAPSSAGGAPARALGWQENQSGATFSLLSLEADTPSSLSTLEAELTPETSPINVAIDGSRAFVRGHAGAGSPVFASVSFEGDVLSVESPLFQTYTREVLSSRGWAFGVGSKHVEARELGASGSSLVEVSREVVDVAAADGAEAALVRSADGKLQLEVARGTVTESVEVFPAAERVLHAGDRWLVLSTRSAVECAQLGIDCAGYQPHIAIAGGDPLAIIDKLALPSESVAIGPLSRVEERWAASAEYGPAPVDIGAGHWVLTREQSATCLTERDCDALGVSYVPISEANVATGQQAECPPTAPPSCNSEPLPEPTVYGTTTRRTYFVFDAQTGAFSDGVDIATEGDMDWGTALWSGPRRSANTLLDLRVQVLERNGGTPRRVRFWLERLTEADSALVRGTPLSIPGYPIGLLDDATLLTAQPERGETGRARLHRVNVGEERAQVESTRVLEARYGDVRIAGKHAVYLKLPSTSCEPETELEAIALDGATLEAASDQLALPGSDWQFVTAHGDALVLSQQNRAFARVAVGADGELSLEAFATAPWYLTGISWRDGVLTGLARDGVVRLAL